MLRFGDQTEFIIQASSMLAPNGSRKRDVGAYSLS
jgi:hypothetical protein